MLRRSYDLRSSYVFYVEQHEHGCKDQVLLPAAGEHGDASRHGDRRKTAASGWVFAAM